MAKSPCVGWRVCTECLFGLTFVVLLVTSVVVSADEIAPVKHPFLEWYGLWPGRTAIGEDGQTWTQDKPEGVRLAVQLARKSRIFIQREKPWEQSSANPITAIAHDGKIKLWYRAAGVEENAEMFVAYAESDDGFNWQRPNVGVVEYQGSTANNLLFRIKDFASESIFLDPSAPPQERYKAISRTSIFYYKGVRQESMSYERKWKIRREMDAKGYTREQKRKELYFELFLLGATSPDGLRWHFIKEPILAFGRSGLDSQNIASYDPTSGKYAFYLRRGKDRRRSVVRSEGDDFRKMGSAHFVFGADAQDPISDDVYASSYCRYPGTDYHLMFPAFYHRLTSCIDVQLAISRDGVQWTRPGREPIISRQFDGGEYGMVFAHPNLVPLNDQEWGVIMHGNLDNHDWGQRYKHNKGLDWRWAVWKKDRLVALEAPVQGRVTTVGRMCHGQGLRINFKTQREGGWIKIELVEPPTSPPKQVEVIDGFSLDEADVLTGDHFDKTVTWKGKDDLSSLKGRKISIRIHMARAKLFSISL